MHGPIRGVERCSQAARGAWKRIQACLSAVRLAASCGGSCVRPGEGISPQRASIPAHADGPSRNNISALPWFFLSRGRPAPEPAQNQARINGSVAAEDGFSLARMPPPHPTRLATWRDAGFHQFAAPPQKAFAAVALPPPSILVRRLAGKFISEFWRVKIGILP